MRTEEEKRADRAADHAMARAELLLAIDHIEGLELPEDVKGAAALALVPAMLEYLAGEADAKTCGTCGQPLVSPP